jgi:hypothetical protein
VRVYTAHERAAAAANALSRGLGEAAKPCESLARADIGLASFGRDIAENGDDYGVGLLMLQACSEGFGERRDVVIEGELIIKENEPVLVHGDLRVAGPIVNGSQLLVTGDIEAVTIYNGGYATVLGDVRARSLTTGGHCYVGASITGDVLWAGDFSDSWLLPESIKTTVFIECPSHALDSRTIQAAVRASVNEENEYPLTMLLADVFAMELYEADGMHAKQTLFE